MFSIRRVLLSVTRAVRQQNKCRQVGWVYHVHGTARPSRERTRNVCSATREMSYHRSILRIVDVITGEIYRGQQIRLCSSPCGT